MKGQNLRLFLGATSANKKAIAKATNCDVHVAAQTESASTKDSTGDWDELETVGKSWDCKAECQFVSTDAGATTVADVLALLGTAVYIDFAPASGANNRTAGTKLLGGQAIVTDINITSSNRQTVTASMSFSGNGALS